MVGEAHTAASLEVKAAHGSPGTLPILTHGDVQLSQSLAIESYLAQIAPKYAGLDAVARAKDIQFSAIKDDLMMGLAGQLMQEGGPNAEATAGVYSKFFTLIEGIVPAEGFINGQEFPTAADFACLVMTEGQTPYCGVGNTAGLAKGGLASYPKFSALCARIKNVPEVTEYLAKSTTMGGNIFGLPEEGKSKERSCC